MIAKYAPNLRRTLHSTSRKYNLLGSMDLTAASVGHTVQSRDKPALEVVWLRSLSDAPVVTVDVRVMPPNVLLCRMAVLAERALK